VDIGGFAARRRGGGYAYGVEVPSSRPPVRVVDALGIPYRFVRCDGATRRRLLGATLELTRASLQLALIPASRKIGLLGKPLAPTAATGAEMGPDDEDLRQAVRIGRAVGVAASRLPWHPLCLAQAMATRRLLDRAAIPSVITLGVRTASSFEAHAWVTVGPYVVVGGGVGPFAQLARFSSTPASAPEGRVAPEPSPGAVAAIRSALDRLS